MFFTRILSNGLCSLMLLIMCGLPGCSALGPRSVIVDRGSYIDAVAQSGKEQVLNNLLRYRYGDVTAFVDLEQIVSGYSYGGTLGVNMLPDQFADTAEIGGTLKYEGRPTLTYLPLNGRGFYKNIMTPVPPEAVFAVLRAGWPVDLVLGTTVQKINHLSNAIGVGRHRKPPDAQFWEVVELIEKLYNEGVLDFRIDIIPQSQPYADQQQPANDPDTPRTLLWLEDSTASQISRREIAALKSLMGLDPQLSEFEMRYARVSERPNQIVIATRSIMTILASFAAKIKIPEAHIADGRAPDSILSAGNPHGLALNIKWGKAAPDDVYVKTRYQGLWYWIDNTDYPTKRTFSFLNLLFSLSDRSETTRPPLVTIQAN